MNVIKIVVDELPERCIFCHNEGRNINNKAICTAKAKAPYPIIDVSKLTRPDLCPLVVEDVCEWTQETSLYDNIKFYVSPHNKYDNVCNDYQMNENVYCLTCGKRIKYVEVE